MRVPMDLDAYQKRSQDGPCFICAMLAGQEDYDHEIVLDDGEHVAFLSRYPTVYGYVLVAPRVHAEHILRDLSAEAYLRMQATVYRVGRALESVVPSARTYVFSLGSQEGNPHIHWHIAPLPPGTPYEKQQFHALMTENGIIPWSAEQGAELGARIRTALSTLEG